MSPDWIKFDTQLIISVQLLIRKRKIEKNSCVFKKKKGNNQPNESDRIWNKNFQVFTVSRPWAKLFNYISIKDISYHKKRQHSPTPAVWLFLRILSKLDERTMPVSLSALEISFMGIEQEELAIIPFFYRPCNVQCTVQGMRSIFIMYTFCDLHTHSMLLFQETLGKGFIHHAVGRYFYMFMISSRKFRAKCLPGLLP